MEWIAGSICLMAHEITKRIKGHDYRYVVSSYRDPQTQKWKERWQYVGVVDNGEVRAPDRKPRKRISREEIVEATARLLEFRSPQHITASVIAAGAGTSRSAFYRQFRSSKEAITEALMQIADDAISALPPLRAPRSLEDAREQLRLWCQAFDYSAELNLTCKRAVPYGYLSTLRGRFQATSNVDKPPVVRLSAFFKQLNDAGFATIEDPEALADAVKALHAARRLSKVALLPADNSMDYDELYPLIERAVFGGSGATPAR